MKNAGTDPLEAGPGTELAGGRFEYQRRLGAGSTAVGILVKDNQVGGALRVLKVAKDSDAAERLRAEAQVLGRFENDDRIVTLHGVEDVGGRVALILRYAGRTTLAEELNNRGRLSIDVLQRWGTDLLTALCALERNGVTHRDIKPSNLVVYQSSSRADTHLVMFDFSMAGVSPDNVEAGTPPYLDPFLGSGTRRRYDTAAERYGAAVVLFEMATGDTPRYGPDPGAHPATVDADVTVQPAMFEVTLAPALVTFFTAALSRDAARRPDTAEDMLRAWQQVFTAADTPASPQVNDADAEKADAATALSSAGLSARSVSALASAAVTTVGELLAVDSTTLNRLMAREAKDTRKEIVERYRAWSKRLGKQQPQLSGTELRSLDDTVALLLSAVSVPRSSTTRRDAAALLLGATPGLDGFASSTELAEKLGKAPQRGTQLIKELQEDWANTPATRELLDALTGIARGVIEDFGGVAAVSTLTAEIRSRLPQAGSGGIDPNAERAAAGLLRVALDRLHEHETASDEKTLVRRRHGRRLALLATDEMLLSAAEAAAKRADEMVSADPKVVIPAARAAAALRSAFQAGYTAVADTDATAPMPSDGRLVRLAAAIAKHAAVSGRGEVHNNAMSPAVAVAEALRGLAQNETLSVSQIRSRVTARFPELDKVPQRPHLDTILAQTSLNLTWDATNQVYRFPDAEPPSSTSMQTRQPTALPATEVVADSDQTINSVALLRHSIDEAGFLAIGVLIPRDRPGEHERVARHLATTYGGDLVDVTTELIAGMQKLADERSIPWDLIREADAAQATARDAQGLRAVIDRVVPALREKLRTAVFEGERSTSPLILTEVSPLARYRHLDLLAMLSDLSAPRRRPVWVVLPQLRGQIGALVDCKPIQLGSPGGQFVLWRESVDAVSARGDGGIA